METTAIVNKGVKIEIGSNPFLFLSVVQDGVKLSVDHKPVCVVKTMAEFADLSIALAKALGIDPTEMSYAASSTLDFPEEATSNPEVLALVAAMRRGQ